MLKSVLRIAVMSVLIFGVTSLSLYFKDHADTRYLAIGFIAVVSMLLCRTRWFSTSNSAPAKTRGNVGAAPASVLISSGGERAQTNAYESNPAAVAIRKTIEATSENDPLIGPKLGASEVVQRLVNGLKNDKGVHIESLLCMAGALAGYSCQANLRAQLIAMGLPAESAFHFLQGPDGVKYFAGDNLNKPLAEMKYSVWGLAAAAAQQAGCVELPDVGDIFTHTIKTIGSGGFGIPRVPENHKAGDLPINYLRTVWPVIHPVVTWFCLKPSDWPVLYGIAIQQIIEMGKNVIDPRLALSIVMEAAIPMSKVDLGNDLVSLS